MEPGELELRKAFEEVTTKNVRTVIEYTTSTRTLVRELEEKLELANKKIMQYEERFQTIQSQMAIVQAKLYKYE